MLNIIRKQRNYDLKVAQIVQHLKPGGIEAMAIDLAEHKTMPDSTFLVSLEGEAKPSLEEWPRLRKYAKKIYFLNKLPGIRPLLILKLLALFKKNKVNAVHTHHIGPLLYAGIAARLAGIKAIIHTEHDAWHLSSKKRRVLQKLIINIVQPLMVADARMVANSLKKRLGLETVNIIRNGVDTQYFSTGESYIARDLLKLPHGATLIGSAGRLEKVKGHDLLIEALSRMPEQYHLAIAGQGRELNALKKQVEDLYLSHRVHFLGLIENMPLFYQTLDLFCLPSRQEGYPLSSLEAQSCGIPTALTDVGGASETLCKQSGILLRPNDPIDMAERLLALSNIEIKTNPRTFIQQHACLSNVCERYVQLMVKPL